MQLLVRRATPRDIDGILDLLTEYDLPRAYFEPYYYRDPTYRPEHSWLVEVDGRLAAHLRVYDRWIYMHGVTVHIAGIGNVITARAFRGQGFASQLLRAVTRDAPDAGFAYSLLWTHLPALYERFGWVGIDQEAIHASLNRVSEPCSALQYTADDLPHVMRLYERTNQLRTGPTVRSAEYWRAQPAWTREDPDGFLLTRGSGGSLTGYIRSRGAPSRCDVLELGTAPGELKIGRHLVECVASRRSGQIAAQLPPSLHDVIPRRLREVMPLSGLMGRVLDLRALLNALEPVLVRRMTAAGLEAWSLALRISDGTRHVRMTNRRLTVDAQPVGDAAASLSEVDFAHLLFHGYDAKAATRFQHRSDADVLCALFPAQDFVIWPADAF
jgi:GNAT superfamily N-acetyltransferase